MKLFKQIFVAALCLLCFQTARAEWIKRDAETLAWFYDVYFVGEKNGWIAGSGGTLLETKDGGEHWEILKKFTDDNLKQVYFSDENNGWLLCERSIYNRGGNASSYLLQTSDGGVNWRKTEFGTGERGRMTKVLIDKFGSGVAFGEGGAYYTHAPSEEKWQKAASPTRYLLLDAIFNDDAGGVIVGAGGTILFTEDAGEKWNQANVYGDKTAKFNSVFFANPKNGWTAGTNGKIFQTTGGGRTWREQNSGTSNNLNDIFFLNTAEGYAVGDDGTILHTTTAGNVWSKENSPVRHKLEKVFFTAAKGYAVGFGGTILEYARKAASKPEMKRKN